MLAMSRIISCNSSEALESSCCTTPKPARKAWDQSTSESMRSSSGASSLAAAAARPLSGPSQALDHLVIELGHHLAHRCRQPETVADQIVEMGQPALVVQGHATAHQATRSRHRPRRPSPSVRAAPSGRPGSHISGGRFAHLGSAQSSGKYAEFMAEIQHSPFPELARP